MKIILDKKALPERGSFGQLLKNEVLHVPMEYAPFIIALGVPTVETLYDLAMNDPKHVSEAFSWTDIEFQNALTKLQNDIMRVKPKYLETLLRPCEDLYLGYKMKDL